MKTFSLTRFLRCMKWTLLLERSYLRLQAMVYIAIATFFMFIDSSSSNPDNVNVFKLVFLSAFYVLCMAAFMLYEAEKPVARLRMMMMPFSNCEKYLSRICIYLLGSFLFIFAGEMVADLVHWSLCNAVGHKTAWITPLYFSNIKRILLWATSDHIAMYGIALLILSLSLLSGVTFRRIGFGLLCVIIILITIALPESMTVSILLSILFIAASYKIFCNIQFITRKWLQL